MKAMWLLEAVGAALLFMLLYFFPLILPFNLALYHHRLPMTSIGGGLLLDLLFVFVLGVLTIAATSRLPDRPRRFAAALLTVFIFWRAANLLFELVKIAHSNLVTTEIPRASDFGLIVFGLWHAWGRTITAGLLLVLLSLAIFRPDHSRAITRAVRLALAGFAFCALWVLPQLIYATFASHPRALASMRTDSHFKDRVVWILFDELSYDVLFDHRPTGLSFPNFDALRATSYSFGDVQPVGFFTERIIPSLLAGQPMDKIRSGRDGNLSYFDDTQQRWIAYDPSKSLFGVAQSNGWNPGVDGWYNPYCRVFSAVLSACQWRPGIDVELPFETKGASENNSAMANALVIPLSIIARFSGHPADDQNESLKRNIQDYNTVMKRGTDLIRNDQVHFVFIHVPAPHPPGMYNRATHELSESGDYLDNMVLADDSLRSLMHEIDSSQDANRTTIVVSSDHSWRVPIWKLGSGWTDEEQRVSQGNFDPRPVLLIHFPGQNSADDVPSPLSELAEHDIVMAMLGRKISSPENLDAFLRSSTQRQGD